MILQVTCLQPFACERWITFLFLSGSFVIFSYDFWWKQNPSCWNAPCVAKTPRLLPCGKSSGLVGGLWAQAAQRFIQVRFTNTAGFLWDVFEINPWICGFETPHVMILVSVAQMPKRQPTWPWSGLKCQHFKPDGHPTRPKMWSIYLWFKLVPKNSSQVICTWNPLIHIIGNPNI